jgi:hypothetical protein
VLFLLFFSYALSAPAVSAWRFLRRRRRRQALGDASADED